MKLDLMKQSSEVKLKSCTWCLMWPAKTSAIPNRICLEAIALTHQYKIYGAQLRKWNTAAARRNTAPRCSVFGTDMEKVVVTEQTGFSWNLVILVLFLWGGGLQRFQTFLQHTLGQTEGGNSSHSSPMNDLGSTSTSACWVVLGNKTLLYSLSLSLPPHTQTTAVPCKY